MREIRFQSEPLSLPSEKVILQLSDNYGVVVDCECLGENGYTKGKIVGRCR